jgi:uncharacterized protein (DUF433 family)
VGTTGGQVRGVNQHWSVRVNAVNAHLRSPDGWLRYDGDVQQFNRITMDPEVMGGKPCIRGMRVTVGMIVEAMASGRNIEQLLADFPYIEEADIRDALAFAARLAQGHEIRLAS